MGKRIIHSHKNIKWNCPSASTNTKFVLPPQFLLSSQLDSTNNCDVTLIAHDQPSPVSNLTTTNQVDNDINNDDYTQYFTTPRKHNHSTPEITKTTTKTTPVNPNVYSLQLQISYST